MFFNYSLRVDFANFVLKEILHGLPRSRCSLAMTGKKIKKSVISVSSVVNINHDIR